jgi:hypothetical protein
LRHVGGIAFAPILRLAAGLMAGLISILYACDGLVYHDHLLLLLNRGLVIMSGFSPPAAHNVAAPPIWFHKRPVAAIKVPFSTSFATRSPVHTRKVGHAKR